MKRAIATVVLVVLMAPFARGQAMMIPEDHRWGPLQLESHRVTVDIEDQTARTRVVEVFRNQHSAQLEATLIFPLAKNASISDFKMYVNGRLVTGEIAEAQQARRIYEDIVRQTKDPGLLEYIDNRMLRLRVFPIPQGSTQEVQIAFEQTLPAEGGLVEYDYPTRISGPFAKTIRDYTLTVNISSSAGVKNVYSPTHDVSVRNIDDKHAVAGFERGQAALDRDFQLFYEVTNKDFGASLLSTKPGGKDGFFLLLLSPRVDVAADKVMPKDVTFVIDTSGSMNGSKLDQAKKALEFCVNALNPGDRFNIISFSIGVEKFSKTLSDVNAENRRWAGEFINNLKASGGTNIGEALATALDQSRDEKRPSVVIFMTDGLATVGRTQPGEILSGVREKNRANVRIFSFGVGYDVNTVMLDQISEATRGATQYVEPNESIEVKVSSFFQKIGDPVLSDIKVDFAGAGAYNVFPPSAGDLFRGGQITMTGRYRNSGGATVTVRGRGANGETVLEYPVDFSAGTGRADFVSNIWAGRKIGYLLGEIRLHGENSELKDEVIRLSKEFGIVTPYTSYLITEGTPIVRRMPPTFEWRRRLPPQPIPLMEQSDRRLDALGYIGGGSGGGSPRGVSAKESAALSMPAATAGAPVVGKDAVTSSRAYAYMVTDVKEDKGYAMRSAGGRTFYNVGGTWVDDGVKPDQKVIDVQFGSEEYFALYAKVKALKEAFALGGDIVISVGKYCLVISDEKSTDVNSQDYRDFLEAVEGLK